MTHPARLATAALAALAVLGAGCQAVPEGQGLVSRHLAPHGGLSVTYAAPGPASVTWRWHTEGGATLHFAATPGAPGQGQPTVDQTTQAGSGQVPCSDGCRLEWRSSADADVTLWLDTTAGGTTAAA